jgi:hypothetical protein
VQLGTCEEISNNAAFSKGNIGDLKTLFESRGGKCKNLHEKLDVHFEGACFLVASNGLPSISLSWNNDHKDDWEPMLARMRIVTLTE